MTSENPEVIEVLEQFERCQKRWESLKTGMTSLETTVKPWKEMTSCNDKLSQWFDDLEREATQHMEAIGEVNDETTDVCDHIFNLKVYH